MAKVMKDKRSRRYDPKNMPFDGQAHVLGRIQVMVDA